MRKFVVSTCATTAKLAVRLGKGHDTFEEALDARNGKHVRDHNKYGIYLVYTPEIGGESARLATAQ